MIPLPARSVTSLEPVRKALLADAERDAAATIRAAAANAARQRSKAISDADGVVRAARADGERQATDAVATRLARGRRDAHALLLATRRRLYDELRAQCGSAAIALRDTPDYPDVRSRLIARAHAELGPDARITESPDGGVIATLGSRRIDLSLPTLVAQTLERLGSSVEKLWTP